MIALKRLPAPKILAERAAEWQRGYDAQLASRPGTRPPSSKYAHQDIVATLRSMSHEKCFYCEGEGPFSVDHYLEVAERRDLAFTWENLYLSCVGCQSKQPNTAIAAADCVDPCDPATRPSQHLAFNKEMATFASAQGDQTIRKYRLNRPLLVSERRRLLQKFAEDLFAMTETKGRRDLTANEQAKLARYGQADGFFSLMFQRHLRDLGLVP